VYARQCDGGSFRDIITDGGEEQFFDAKYQHETSKGQSRTPINSGRAASVGAVRFLWV